MGKGSWGQDAPGIIMPGDNGSQNEDHGKHQCVGSFLNPPRHLTFFYYLLPIFQQSILEAHSFIHATNNYWAPAICCHYSRCWGYSGAWEPNPCSRGAYVLVRPLNRWICDTQVRGPKCYAEAGGKGVMRGCPFRQSPPESCSGRRQGSQAGAL